MRVLLMRVVAAALSVGPAMAQDADPRNALAARLVEVSQGAKMNQQIVAMVEGELEDLDGVPDDQAAWMRANAPRLALRMVGKILEELTTVYAEAFTERELRAQIAFFETPEGRTIADKSVALGERQAVIVAEAQLAYFSELTTKYCAEFDCPAAAEKSP